jgi:ABC-type transport system involved in cytochrome c biogenesis permease component
MKRAWERGSEMDQGDGSYDVVLISDLPYSVTSLRKLYALLTKVRLCSYCYSYILFLFNVEPQNTPGKWYSFVFGNKVWSIL